MDKLEKLESILKTVKTEVEKWIDEEEQITDPIIYESQLLERCLRIGSLMVIGTRGKVAKDRNAKKKS